MIDQTLIENTIKIVIKTGKVILGRKNVIHSLKGCKLTIYSSSIPKNVLPQIQQLSKSTSTPLISYKGNSIQLGRICKKPFRVSILGIKTPGDADLSPLIEEK
jgi:large subunit ribosomal protein L30e